MRLRRAEGEEREQLKWFAFFASLGVFGIFVAFLSLLSETEWSELIGTIGWITAVTSLTTGLPLAIGIAILRYRLYDIDWIINRTLVYVPLTALLAGVYIALTGVFRTFLSDSTGGTSDAAIAFTTVVVVAILTPAKNYLQARVDRHFGDAGDPTKAIDKLTQETRSAAELLDYGLFIQRFLENVIDIFDSRSGRIHLEDAAGTRTFVYGDQDAPVALRLTLRHEEQDYGSVQIGIRKNGRPYSAAESRALEKSVDALARLVSVSSASRPKMRADAPV